jgi:hypothetical protein
MFFDVTIPPSRRPTGDTKKHSPDTPFDMVVKAKDETIAALKAEIERLSEQVVVKDEQIKASTRLLEAQKADPYAAILDRLEAIEKEVVSTSPEPATEPPPKSFWQRLVG